MATHSSILAGQISWTEEPGGRQSTGSQRVRYGSVTNIALTMKLWSRYYCSHVENASLWQNRDSSLGLQNLKIIVLPIMLQRMTGAELALIVCQQWYTLVLKNDWFKCRLTGEQWPNSADWLLWFNLPLDITCYWKGITGVCEREITRAINSNILFLIEVSWLKH